MTSSTRKKDGERLLRVYWPVVRWLDQVGWQYEWTIAAAAPTVGIALNLTVLLVGPGFAVAVFFGGQPPSGLVLLLSLKVITGVLKETIRRKKGPD